MALERVLATSEPSRRPLARRYFLLGPLTLSPPFSPSHLHHRPRCHDAKADPRQLHLHVREGVVLPDVVRPLLALDDLLRVDAREAGAQGYAQGGEDARQGARVRVLGVFLGRLHVAEHDAGGEEAEGEDLRLGQVLTEDACAEARRGEELGLHEHGECAGVEVAEGDVLERLLDVVHGRGHGEQQRVLLVLLEELNYGGDGLLVDVEDVEDGEGKLRGLGPDHGGGVQKVGPAWCVCVLAMMVYDGVHIASSLAVSGQRIAATTIRCLTFRQQLHA